MKPRNMIQQIEPISLVRCSTGAIGKTCWNVTHPLKRVSLQKVENKRRQS